MVAMGNQCTDRKLGLSWEDFLEVSRDFKVRRQSKEALFRNVDGGQEVPCRLKEEQEEKLRIYDLPKNTFLHSFKTIRLLDVRGSWLKVVGREE